MTDGYTSDQIRAAEKPLLDAGEPLMQRAATALAGEIRTLLANRGSDPGVVLVIAGSGDNGGDALFAGAQLAADGVDVRILTTADHWHDAGFDAAVSAGADAGRAAVAPDSDDFGDVIEGVDVIVDGVLGIGTTSDPSLRGRARDLVAAVRPRVLMRMMGAPIVVAVDVPSGIGVDDGSVPHGPILPATVTVTFGAVKAGLLLSPAAGLAGRIVLVDLGLDLSGVEPAVVSAD